MGGTAANPVISGISFCVLIFKEAGQKLVCPASPILYLFTAIVRFSVLYRLCICPVILNIFSKGLAVDIIVQIFLHEGTDFGVVIIRIVIVVRNQLAGVDELLDICAQIIGAGNFVVGERGYACAGIRDQHLSILGIDQPVQEIFGSLALFIAGMFAAVDVEELGTAAYQAVFVFVIQSQSLMFLYI